MNEQKFVTEDRQKRVAALAAKIQDMVLREGGAQWEEYAAALGVTAKAVAISVAELTDSSKESVIEAVRGHLEAGFATPIQLQWPNAKKSDGEQSD